MARGVGLATTRERWSVFTFAATSSSAFGAPFFRGAQAEKGVGVVFLDAQLTPKLRAFSRNVFSDQQTTISGVEWGPREGLTTSLASGFGANSGYLASSFERSPFSVPTSR